MTNVTLHGADDKRRNARRTGAAATARAHHSPKCGELNRIAQLCPRTVRLNVDDRVRINPCVGVRAAKERLLRGRIRRRHAVRPSVLVHRDTAQHSVRGRESARGAAVSGLHRARYCIDVARRDDDGAAALSPNVPVRAVVAEPAARRRAEHPGTGEGRRPFTNQLNVDTGDDGAMAAQSSVKLSGTRKKRKRMSMSKTKEQRRNKPKT